ncbi:GTPase-activating protein gyp1 [Chlorella vulgaris]
MSSDGGFPGVRGLFKGRGFPGTVKFSRKGASPSEGEEQQQQQPPRHVDPRDPVAAGVAGLSVESRPMESISSTSAPPPSAASSRGARPSSGSSAGDASRRTSSADEGGGGAGGGGGGAQQQGGAEQQDGVEVTQLRSMSSTRVAKFMRLLDEQVVDLEALRELSWSGIPPSLRPMCWRLLLGYLPPNRERRMQILTRKRREYRDLVPDYYEQAASGLDQSGEELGALRQVAVDVPRTAPGVAFFHDPQVQKSLERILYIWGLRHPASGYVQGINDLVTPFMCTFMGEHMQGPLEGWSLDGLPESQLLDVEADCYWCLCKLLDGIQDHYTYAQPGIQRCVRVEEPLAAHLEAEGLQFIQFAFRWVNCLLLREVPFPLAIRLWDTYLSEGSQLKDFLGYTLAAFLLSWSSQLQQLEFQELIMFLQKPPTADWCEKDIELVLSRAYMWRASFKGASSHFS